MQQFFKCRIIKKKNVYLKKNRKKRIRVIKYRKCQEMCIFHQEIFFILLLRTRDAGMKDEKSNITKCQDRGRGMTGESKKDERYVCS